MTISYPRSLPSTLISRVQFDPEPQEATSGEQGGRYLSVQLGPMIWRASIATTPPSETEFSKWRAWLDSLDGAGKEFYGYDPRRPYPWAYRKTGWSGLTRAVSGGAFNGTSSSWSVNSGRDEITIGAAANQQLPVGFSMSEGDYIGLVWTTSGAQRRSLHRALEPYNANSSGVGIWSVRPTVSPAVPSNATINLFKAACLMVVTKRDRSAEQKSRSIAFDAVQNLEF